MANLIHSPPGCGVDSVARERTLSSSLWIGNVSSKVRDDELRALFSPFGEIVSLKVLRRSQCAFVNYATPAAATVAKRHVQVRQCGYSITNDVIHEHHSLGMNFGSGRASK